MNRRRLSWSEPWDWERAKQGVRAASRAMPFRRFAVYGLAIPLVAVLAVRFGVEGVGEVLTWWRIAALTAACLGFYVLAVCNGMMVFANVTFGRKRVDILYGADGSGRIPYDQVESFSFERWHDALCLVAIGLVLLEGGLYWLMMRAGGLSGLSREYFMNRPSASLCTVLVQSVLLNPVWIAGVLGFGQIAVPIWALAVGQIAWLLGAYAVGRHWRHLNAGKRRGIIHIKGRRIE